MKIEAARMPPSRSALSELNPPLDHQHHPALDEDADIYVSTDWKVEVEVNLASTPPDDHDASSDSEAPRSSKETLESPELVESAASAGEEASEISASPQRRKKTKKSRRLRISILPSRSRPSSPELLSSSPAHSKAAVSAAATPPPADALLDSCPNDSPLETILKQKEYTTHTLNAVSGELTSSHTVEENSRSRNVTVTIISSASAVPRTSDMRRSSTDRGRTRPQDPTTFTKCRSADDSKPTGGLGDYLYSIVSSWTQDEDSLAASPCPLLPRCQQRSDTAKGQTYDTTGRSRSFSPSGGLRSSTSDLENSNSLETTTSWSSIDGGHCSDQAMSDVEGTGKDKSKTKKKFRRLRKRLKQYRPYFTKRDFSKRTWETVTNNPASNLSAYGLAAVMTATVFIHPLVFIAGAATAFWAVGIFHAVDKGYEFFSDGSFARLFWGESDLQAIDADPNASVEADIIVTNPYNVDGLCMKRTDSLKKTTEVDVIGASPTALSLAGTGLAAKGADKLITVPAPAANRTEGLDTLPLKEVIQLHFPSLDVPVVSGVEFPGLNALEFFDVFFSNDAPYSFKEFQAKRGDIDLDFGEWKRQPDDEPFSFHIQAKRPADLPRLPLSSRKERILNFKTLTKSPLGPTYAIAKKTQRVTKFSKRNVVIESRTDLEGIPFCDRFFVLERWMVEAMRHDPPLDPASLKGQGQKKGKDAEHYPPIHYTAQLAVTVQVFMLRSSSWEKQIRSKTLSTVKDIVASWCKKAIKALQLTEQIKLERMRSDEEAGIKRDHSDDLGDAPSVGSDEHFGGDESASAHGEFLGETDKKLLDIHMNNVKELTKQIVAGDLECFSIEVEEAKLLNESNAEGEIPATTMSEDTPYIYKNIKADVQVRKKTIFGRVLKNRIVARKD